MWRLGLAFVALASCYRPASDVACTVTCTGAGPCPGALVCGGDGLCHGRGTPECTGSAALDSQLGDAPKLDALLPDGGPPGCVLDIAVGQFTSCALRSDHTVWCWGNNNDGQIGNNQTGGGVLMPSKVMNLPDATAIAIGRDAAYAIKTNGQVVAWGNNIRGALGDGTTNNHTTPQLVSVLQNVVEIAAGTDYACAREANANIYCWGEDVHGKLGTGDTNQRNSPVFITTGLDISASGDHTCAIASDSSVVCWGRNSWANLNNGGGAVGDNSTTDRSSPTAVNGGLHGVEVVAAGRHSCARTIGGAVWCWGANPYGEVDGMSQTQSLVPIQVANVSGAIALYASGHHTCAMTTGGGVSCWGEQLIGMPNTGLVRTMQPPSVTPELAGARRLALASYHTCMIRNSDGAILCAGRGAEGQLGDGMTADRTTFAVVALACPP